MRILSQRAEKAYLRQVTPVDAGPTGSRRFPYLNLSDEDFERLLHSLARFQLQKEGYYDRVRLALAGGDAGIDVSLWKDEQLVGVMQCKRLSYRMPRPDALKEILKFLLFLIVDGDMPPPEKRLRYYLVLATDPARTTDAFFKKPRRWIEENHALIATWIEELLDKHASLSQLSLGEVLPTVLSRMRTIDYHLLLPAMLDEWLSNARPVRKQFFQWDQIASPAAVERAVGSKLKQIFPERALRPLPVAGRPRRTAAATVSKLVADKLDRSDIYKRNRTVRRADFEQALRRFLAGPANILPIIGFSGVGKTSALAELAEREEAGLPPRLLIRGAEIKPDIDGIADMLERLPWPAAGYSRPDARRLSDFANHRDGPLLVLLDGLNDADVRDPHLRECWLPSTIDWLISHDARLVVTCRPERWSAIQPTIPPRLLHLLPERTDSSGERKREDASARLIRLRDFTREEAAEAVKAYGMESWLSAGAAGHPFLLHLADVLGSRADVRTMNLPQVLEAFIDHRVATALELLGKPRWQPEVTALLGSLAMHMLGAARQNVTKDRMEKLFGNRFIAVDALCDEHLLELIEGEYRFQHDQVREFLQASQLDLTAVRRGIPVLPRRPDFGVPGGWFLFIFLLFQNLGGRLWPRLHGHPELPPAVVAFRLLDLMRGVQGSEVQEVLEELRRAASDPYTSSAKDYARQCILLLLALCPGAAAEHPIFGWWISQMLDQAEFYRDRWSEQVDEAVAAYLRRSSLSHESKRVYLSRMLAREDEFHWRGADVARDAFWETLWRQTTTLNQAFQKSPSARLIEYLLEVDLDDTIDWLGAVLDDDRLLTSVGDATRPRLPVRTIAMRTLFRFRDLAPERIIWTTLAASSASAAKLLEAFAQTHPDELASACLTCLADARPEQTERLQRALWYAADSPFMSGEEMLPYAVRLLSSGQARGMELVWAIRIFFAHRARHRHMTTVPDLREHFLELLSILQPIADQAIVLLRAHLQVNHEADLMAVDFLYLLEEDFEAGLELLQQQIQDAGGLRTSGFAAIENFLTARRVREPQRMEKYSRLVQVLSRYLDLHGEQAAAVMAEAVLKLLEATGRQSYAFSFAEAEKIRLPELGLGILAVGGEAVWRVCSTLVWPCHWRIRKAIFRQLRTAPLSGSNVESLVKTLCDNSHVVPRRLALVYLKWLRVEGREIAWDEAVRRHLYHASGREGSLAESLLIYWRRLPTERQSPISGAVTTLLENGRDLKDATDPRGPAGVRWRGELKPKAAHGGASLRG
ncbi:hypothetical protein [Sphingosinicella terrae]|uniref:hypothetical protein n=1 Tax=Sphingosinicella terrae TaxID=2172047 RepID=UPI000E0D4B82|nr:hypothetical protein [Sphingosinicella terrae]